MAWLITGSREIAEDVVHDAFVRLSSLEWPNNPEGYLRTMVVNACRSHIRHADIVRQHTLKESPRSKYKLQITYSKSSNRCPSGKGRRWYCDFIVI